MQCSDKRRVSNKRQPLTDVGGSELRPCSNKRRGHLLEVLHYTNFRRYIGHDRWWGLGTFLHTVYTIVSRI